ncbi:MAG: hypothetical protein KBT66_03570 [Amphritea sp.]|nr:hypothetical protein [Amphritea sp.]MBQ0783290.1 hypothetical protein [Amphritea sp.]
MSSILLSLLTFSVFSFSLCSYAGEADVVDVTVSKSGNDLYRFRVTVLHEDSGWDHYANKWEVLDPQGKVLSTRVLHHPHVGEQPFTRSLSGVRIESGVKSVTVRAHDLVHGYGGKPFTINLPD